MDCLSTLADNLLVHILSFLPLKEGISANTLSRRWRLLWTCLTTLYFKIYHKSAFINLIFHRGFKIRSFNIDIDVDNDIYNYHVSDDEGDGNSLFIKILMQILFTQLLMISLNLGYTLQYLVLLRNSFWRRATRHFRIVFTLSGLLQHEVSIWECQSPWPH